MECKYVHDINYGDVIKLLESYKNKISKSIEGTSDLNYLMVCDYKIVLLDVAINIIKQYSEALDSLKDYEEDR